MLYIFSVIQPTCPAPTLTFELLLGLQLIIRGITWKIGQLGNKSTITSSMQVSSFPLLKYFNKNSRLLLNSYDFNESLNLDLKPKLIHFDKSFQKKSRGKFLVTSLKQIIYSFLWLLWLFKVSFIFSYHFPSAEQMEEIGCKTHGLRRGRSLTSYGHGQNRSKVKKIHLFPINNRVDGEK